MNNSLDQVRIMALPGTEEMANSILSHLKDKGNGTPELVNYDYKRFPDGDGKIALTTSVRNKIVFLFVDPYNYGVTYDFHGKERGMSPDEHIANVYDAINSMSGKEAQLYIVSPPLARWRQDRKDGKNESLGMSIVLNNIKDRARKLQGFIAIDSHNPAAFENSLSDFDNATFFPAAVLLSTWIQDIKEDLHNILVVSPDGGAMKRASIYSDILDKSPWSGFYKERDNDKKNSLKKHIYLGNPAKVVGKHVLISDDVISTGGTMLGAAKQLKKMGAKEVSLMASHATFVKGIKKFDKAYEKGYFKTLYTINGSYIPESIKQKPRHEEVDCTPMFASMINCICQGESTKWQMKKSEQKVTEEVRRLKQEYPKKKKTKKNI